MTMLIFYRNWKLLYDNLAWFVPRFEMYNKAILEFIREQGRAVIPPQCVNMVDDGTRRRVTRDGGPPIRD